MIIPELWQQCICKRCIVALNVCYACVVQKADHVSDTEDEADDETADSKGPDYNYILNMSLWSLTNEKRDALLKLRDEKAGELRVLRSKTSPDLWKEDLNKLIAELDVWHLLNVLQ